MGEGCCAKKCSFFDKLHFLPLLLFRLTLAYGFYEPGMRKLQNIEDVTKWFASMNIPYPEISVYLTAGSEVLGVILLALGLGTRLISVPLMVIMGVAIGFVHWENGFSCGNNGFEIPFYYFLMLLALFVNGGGKLSLDHWLCHRKK